MNPEGKQEWTFACDNCGHTMHKTPLLGERRRWTLKRWRGRWIVTGPGVSELREPIEVEEVR